MRDFLSRFNMTSRGRRKAAIHQNKMPRQRPTFNISETANTLKFKNKTDPIFEQNKSNIIMNMFPLTNIYNKIYNKYMPQVTILTDTEACSFQLAKGCPINQ